MKKFENELSQLKQGLIEMGEVAEGMLACVNKAINGRNNEALYAKVLEDEDRLDQMQLDVDQEAVRLLTVFGPVARDLRFVLMVSWIASELERIGDQAVNMCESLRLMAAKTEAAPLPNLIKLSKLVAGMAHDANTAFVENDASVARSTMARDELADALNDQIITELLSDEVLRNALSNPDEIAGALAQVLIARSLERIADRSTNICEKIIYLVKGRDIRHEQQMAS
jgi:phosphate transport system protein